MTFEVKKGGRVYMHGETETPPSKDLLRELLEAGYQPYLNGKRVSKSSLKTKMAPELLQQLRGRGKKENIPTSILTPKGVNFNEKERCNFTA